MQIRVGCSLSIAVSAPTHTLCMVDVHPDRAHDLVAPPAFATSPYVPVETRADHFGNLMRRFTCPPGVTRVTLSGIVSDNGRLDERVPGARIPDVSALPQPVLAHLAPSRYCDSDRLSQTAWTLFGGMPRSTELVEAICDYTHQRLKFDYGLARPTRTAWDAHEERVGVCRDFAHLAISLCRALNIPARYVNGYLGDIGVPADPAPMDFNAWFEAYIDGRWITFDARHNCRRIGRIVIARGRDARDIPMIHTFGPHQLTGFEVVTEEVTSDLATRAPAAPMPCAEAA